MSTISASFASQAGMTLIELILVIVLSGSVGAFVANILFYEVSTYEIIVNRGQASKKARFALQLMSREIRQIVAPDSIFQASSDSIRFANIDGSTIRFKYSNSQLLRNDDLLSDEVTGFYLKYLDDNGVQLTEPIADLTAIRTIAVSLTTATGGQSVQTQISVTPRNF